MAVTFLLNIHYSLFTIHYSLMRKLERRKL